MFLSQRSKFQIQKSKNILQTIDIIDLYNLDIFNNRTALILILIGTFNKNKVVVSCLATTGPDFEVVFGNLKLKLQMPDSIDKTDVSGIMITEKANKLLVTEYLEKTKFWEYNNYYILTGKIVGAKKSDTEAFHPLFEVIAIKFIDKLFFWGLIITIIGLFITNRIMYKKYKNLTK